MSKRLIWTQKALQQLDALDDYLLENAPYYADKIINEVLQAPNRLIEFPSSGQIEEYLTDVGEYRYLVYSHFKIIYRIENKVIYIVALFDTRQDPAKMLKELGED